MAQDEHHVVQRPVFLRSFPEELRRQLAEQAKAAERSLTSEIIYRLKASFRQQANEPA